MLWKIVMTGVNSPVEPPVCILTADHRDIWAKVVF